MTRPRIKRHLNMKTAIFRLRKNPPATSTRKHTHVRKKMQILWAWHLAAVSRPFLHGPSSLASFLAGSFVTRHRPPLGTNATYSNMVEVGYSVLYVSRLVVLVAAPHRKCDCDDPVHQQPGPGHPIRSISRPPVLCVCIRRSQKSHQRRRRFLLSLLLG